MHALCLREWTVPTNTQGDNDCPSRRTYFFWVRKMCQYFWHLGADRQDQYDRFPWAQSWECIPCEDMQRLNTPRRWRMALSWRFVFAILSGYSLTLSVLDS